MVRQEVPDDPQPENSKFWKPKIGDKTEGRLLRSEKGKFGDQFVIRKTDTTEQVLPADTHLMQKLQKVQIGDYVWITMIGEKDTGQPKPMKVYRVEHDPDYKEPPVQNIPPTPSTVTPSAPKVDASAMTEKWKEFLAENLTTPTNEAGIIKLVNGKIPDAAARKPYSETRKAALTALVTEGFLNNDEGKYSVA